MDRFPWRPLSLLFLGLVITDPARAAQERSLSFGAHIGANLLSRPSGPIVGAHVAVTIVGPIEFYPAVEVDPSDGSSSTVDVLLNLRAVVLRGGQFLPLWYLGAGLTNRDNGEVLLTGLGWPGRGVRPFAELRLMGSAFHADGHLQTFLGVRAQL